MYEATKTEFNRNNPIDKQCNERKNMPKHASRLVLLLAVTSFVLTGCATDAAPEATTEAAATTATEEVTTDECVPAHADLTTVEAGFLTVAAYEYPPFSAIDGDSLSGAEGEILHAIAELECLDVMVQPGTGAAMIPAIESGRADTTLGSWYRTAARAEIVLLSNPVIIDQLTLISVAGVDSVEGLIGNKVGSTLGFLWNEDLENVLGKDLSLYETTQALYADLASGRISVVVDTFPSGQAALKNTPVEGAVFKVPAPDDRVVSTTMPGQTNFPVNLNNPGLQEAINNNLDTLRESGVLAEIAEKWGFSPTAVAETVPNLL
jgi:polar amino acid transport system substrate-binding protein